MYIYLYIYGDLQFLKQNDRTQINDKNDRVVKIRFIETLMDKLIFLPVAMLSQT